MLYKLHKTRECDLAPPGHLHRNYQEDTGHAPQPALVNLWENHNKGTSINISSPYAQGKITTHASNK